MKQYINMLLSPKMLDFTNACDTLSSMGEGYDLLKQHLFSNPDKYRRLYVFKVIFEFSEARTELISFLENELLSPNRFFSEQALNNIIKYKLEISGDNVFSALERHKDDRYGYCFLALMHIRPKQGNYERILSLYKSLRANSTKEFCAAALCTHATEEKFEEIFSLLEKDAYCKIRLIACKLAVAFGKWGLLNGFINDCDGHVRKYVKANIR